MAADNKDMDPRKTRLNTALRDNLKRRKQQGRSRGQTALPLEDRPSLMMGREETTAPLSAGQQNGQPEKSVDDPEPASKTSMPGDAGPKG